MASLVWKFKRFLNKKKEEYLAKLRKTRFFIPLSRFFMALFYSVLVTEICFYVSEGDVFYEFCKHFFIVRIFAVLYPTTDYITKNASEVLVA